MRTTIIVASVAMAFAAIAAQAASQTPPDHPKYRYVTHRIVVPRSETGGLYSYNAGWPRCTNPPPFYFANNCNGRGYEWGH